MLSPFGRSSLAATVPELLLFRTGAVDIARSAFAPWLDGASREERVTAPVWSALLRTPDGNILFDTGLHPVHVARPDATFGTQADHLAFAKGKPNFPGVYWDIPELKYMTVSGRSKVARGVEVVPTPGHAPGHQSLVVDLAETGRVVLTGDAAFTRANIERGEIPAMDQAAAKESLALIRSLAKDDLSRVFTSHDADAWATWRHSPDGYR